MGFFLGLRSSGTSSPPFLEPDSRDFRVSKTPLEINELSIGPIECFSYLVDNPAIGMFSPVQFYSSLCIHVYLVTDEKQFFFPRLASPFSVDRAGAA